MVVQPTFSKFYLPVDFIIMDIEEDVEIPLILERPFMKTARIIIDIDEGKLKVRAQDYEVGLTTILHAKPYKL